jgi:hypothetical protein
MVKNEKTVQLKNKISFFKKAKINEQSYRNQIKKNLNLKLN